MPRAQIIRFDRNGILPFQVQIIFCLIKIKLRTGLLETDEIIESTDGIFCSNEGYYAEVRDKDGKVLPAGEKGELFVKSPDLMMGYIGFVSSCVFQIRHNFLSLIKENGTKWEMKLI